MGTLLVLGLVLTGVAVVFALRTVAFGRLRRQETLAQIGAYGFATTEAAPQERQGLRELADRLATGIGAFVLRHQKQSREIEIRRLLRAAGHYRTLSATFVGYRVALTVLLPSLWLWLAVVSGSLGPRVLLAICMMTGLGWILPVFVVRRRGASRIEQIDREMPELVDLLVATVEAGVGFAASIQLVVRRIEGPLGQELRLALREQNMGLTIEDALENMLDRVDSLSLRTFVQAILQGQTLGVSIGKILRDLAVDMRKRRRQMAEERAQKAPTKILFPLVILILPALMIVSLGGPVIGVIHSLGSAV
jgi:tight adherence protein C